MKSSDLFYWVITHTVRLFVMPIYASIDVRGMENVPAAGPLLIASNHLNDADPGIISTSLPRKTVFMTKAELFRVPGLKQFLELYGAFPVRRGEADLSALRRANEALKAGRALVMFPEGTRASMRASLGEAWPGAGLIALRNNATILPIAITGSQDMAMPGMWLRAFRPRKVTLTIGKPFVLDQPQRVNTEASAAGAAVIMQRIAELLPPEYRGYYGGDPPRPSATALPPGEGVAASGQGEEEAGGP